MCIAIEVDSVLMLLLLARNILTVSYYSTQCIESRNMFTHNTLVMEPLLLFILGYFVIYHRMDVIFLKVFYYFYYQADVLMSSILT